MIKIAIFANDAGGSELLLELLKASLHVGDFTIFCSDKSPCADLIKKKNLEKYMQIIDNSKNYILSALNHLKPNIILYATSWQNHIEYYFLEYAKTNKIPSVAFLDNWTNFRERFGYPSLNWRDNFPDFIATHDEESEKKAKKYNLPNIIALKNYALKKQLETSRSTDAKQNHTLLFLSEPTTKVALKTYKDANYWGFDERDVFKSILKNQKKLHCQNIVVRLHPSDKEDIYKQISPHTTISNTSLEEDIAHAKIIIGIDSSALRLAYLLGKKVIAFIPSNKRDFHVPLPKQNQVKSLDKIDINSLQKNNKKIKSYGIEFALFVKNILG